MVFLWISYKCNILLQRPEDGNSRTLTSMTCFTFRKLNREYPLSIKKYQFPQFMFGKDNASKNLRSVKKDYLGNRTSHCLKKIMQNKIIRKHFLDFLSPLEFQGTKLFGERLLTVMISLPQM